MLPWEGGVRVRRLCLTNSNAEVMTATAAIAIMVA